MKKQELPAIADFLFEIGNLAHTPRSGLNLLGSGQQSVAEHVHRVVYTGYVLALMERDVDVSQVMKMCLFHDLAEARISDLNYVHQKYIEPDEHKALQDMANSLDFGKDILDTIGEYEERHTKESMVAKDADQLEWILTLKEHVDTGNSRAESWMHIAVKRLKTTSAKKLAKEVINTPSDRWWFGDGTDEWWVSRTKKTKKK